MANPAAAPGLRDRAGWLRRDAERISGTLPPLLVEADRLATGLVTGVHGRRRAGMGETFWQYRAAHPGDPFSLIDWRRSSVRRIRCYARRPCGSTITIPSAATNWCRISADASQPAPTRICLGNLHASRATPRCAA